METDCTTSPSDATLFAGEAWFDPIEASLRGRVRGFIEDLLEQELAAALGRGRYERRGQEVVPDTPPGTSAAGHRSRRLVGSFGAVEIAVPRARLATAEGMTSEWRSRALSRYARRTRQVAALIAGAYLAGTNLAGSVGRWRRCSWARSKDIVSRTWRKVKTDWDAWCRRSLADEDIVRLILDGTVVRVRLDRKATSISLLVVLGVRRDGQKVLLSIRSLGGESEAAWRSVLDDLVARGLRTPEFLIVDGAAGLEKALAALWPMVPTQRCTVHKHRNLLAHAPKQLHEELSADYTDMIYAETAAEVAKRRKAFLAKWRLKCRGVADSLEEAGDQLFAFARLPPGQWKSARTTNAIERLHEAFKRRIKTQTGVPVPLLQIVTVTNTLVEQALTAAKLDGLPAESMG